MLDHARAPLPHLGPQIDRTRDAQTLRDRIVHFLEHDLGLTRLDQSIRVERRFTPPGAGTHPVAGPPAVHG